MIYLDKFSVALSSLKRTRKRHLFVVIANVSRSYYIHESVLRYIQKFRFNDKFKDTSSPEFIHDGVQMVDYNNQPFIIGDYQHNNIEFMHLSYGVWYSIKNGYPFQKRIFGYAVVSRSNKVFLFGGCCDNSGSVISLFENDQWSKIGHLSQGRMNHKAIIYGTDIMIVGGKSKNNQP